MTHRRHPRVNPVIHAQQAIGVPGFGSDAQTLRPFSGLQEGLVKLS